MSHPHAHRHHPSFRQELRDAVTPRASLLVLGVLALQLLFIASYVGALHRPKPADVPFGVAAPRAVAGQTADRLRRLPGAPLDPRTVADEAAARRQILHRDLDGALVVAPAGATDTLLVASGGGTALATTLEKIVGAAEKTEGRTVRTVDVAPASAGDFDGLSSFYLVVGWSVGGYLCASILAISTGARPANPRRASIRLATMALVAIAGGAGGALIVGPALNALPGGVLQLWGLGALVTFAVGAATLALQGVFGIVGIGLAILLVVIAGNPSAGGAFPLPMLPPFWKAIGPALPPGAGTWAARSIAYFRGNALTDALLVLAAWAAAGVLITLLASALRRKRAGGAAGAVRPAGAAVGATSGEVRPDVGVGAHRYGGEGAGAGLVGGGADAGAVPEGGGADAGAGGAPPQGAGEAGGAPPQAVTAQPGADDVSPASAPRPAAGEAAAAAVGEEPARESEAAQAAAGGEVSRAGEAAPVAAGGASAPENEATQPATPESQATHPAAGEGTPESQAAQPAAGEGVPEGEEPESVAGRASAPPGTGEGDTFVDPGSGADSGPEAPAARPGPDA